MVVRQVVDWSPSQTIEYVQVIVTANSEENNFQEEASHVEKRFRQEYGDDSAETIANPTRVLAKIATRFRSEEDKRRINIHFACHGEITPSGISLDFGTAKLTKWDFYQDATRRIGLAFLNACSSDTKPAKFLATHGMPEHLLINGAQAVVATMWSVKYASARAYSDAFYDSLLEKNATLSEAARAGRKAAKAYSQNGDPTYLAYCLYGEPDARIAYKPRL